MIGTAIGLLLFFTSAVIFAQGMMGDDRTNGAGHTAQEEAEGKALWEKLQAKQVQCSDLSDDDFAALGEYFMGQMMGASHEAMNTMMEQMMGKEGEEQMHIAMGKRMSGCEPNAPLPQSMTNNGMMPMMMQMMMGGNNNNPMMEGGYNPMMGGNNFMMRNLGQGPVWWGGVGSWLFLLFLFVWLVVGILAAIWLWKQIVKK